MLIPRYLEFLAAVLLLSQAGAQHAAIDQTALQELHVSRLVIEGESGVLLTISSTETDDGCAIIVHGSERNELVICADRHGVLVTYESDALDDRGVRMRLSHTGADVGIGQLFTRPIIPQSMTMVMGVFADGPKFHIVRPGEFPVSPLGR